MTERHPKNRALELFEELLAAPAPSGREERIARIVCAKLDEMGYARRRLAKNILVSVDGQGDGPTCCISAHMDEIGLVVTAIEPAGSLRVDRSGGLMPWKIGEGPVEVLGDSASVIGVLSMGSTHTANGADGVTWADVRVITGLSSDQLAEAGVRPGSTGTVTRDRRGPVIFGDPADPLVGAWTFDDRMGVVALLRLLETMKKE